MSATVRISQASWQILRQIAAQAGEPMQAVLDKAVEEYRRKCFLQKANEAFAALKENTEAWQEEIAERKAWEITLEDGIKGDN
ncbi:toxin-antitoxin system protein [Pelotomaculum isophthalicicum JI]|uniref:Toxin-antitoxin system protein n=1 Tax=Pelotomaculum isophthalicicum JI TaxID=947010 RepID=A0A9X4GZI2_9FIRM|nr:toxin-antitoxin system protein [Pelotomaculum isophthalicicum]MDF9408825.1 toxin-antitoxin system protein [Pelotomaculum isophthalicicum JI]